MSRMLKKTICFLKSSYVLKPSLILLNKLFMKSKATLVMLQSDSLKNALENYQKKTYNL